MGLSLEIIKRLADGRFHSGEALAAEFGVTRAAVWKQLKRVRSETGMEIHSVPGRGYRLARPLELLDRDAICSSLSEVVHGRLGGLEIYETIDSTNTYLMSKGLSGSESGLVCLAEQQTAGRGRRGRRWVSPFGTNLYLSVYWQFTLTPADLSGLSLAAGIAVADTLEQLGLSGIGLKWPNDVLWESRKLAGLLLEVAGEQGGPSRVVLGLGVNTLLPSHEAGAIDQPWVDLSGIPGGSRIGRNRLAAALIGNLFDLLSSFEEGGRGLSVERWTRYDVFAGQPVTLRRGDEMIEGIHRGIDPSGALLLERNGALDLFHGGEVTLRPPRR